LEQGWGNRWSGSYNLIGEVMNYKQLEKQINRRGNAIFLPVKKGRRASVSVEFWPAWKIKEILENETTKTPGKVCK
jgi:hypothetical protein